MILATEKKVITFVNIEIQKMKLGRCAQQSLNQIIQELHFHVLINRIQKLFSPFEYCMTEIKLLYQICLLNK